LFDRRQDGERLIDGGRRIERASVVDGNQRRPSINSKRV
jgi:hypothetical protein